MSRVRLTAQLAWLTLALPLLASLPAKAMPPPIDTTIDLNGTPVQLVVEHADGTLRLEARQTRGAIRTNLQTDGPVDISVSLIRLASERRVALVTVQGSRDYSWLVTATPDGPMSIWEGPTGWHGDPGERRRFVIRTDDRTGDGRPDIVIGEEREPALPCGHAGLLNLHAVDPTSLSLRPITLRQLPAETSGASLVASETPPAWAPESPWLRPPSFALVSSTSGHPYRLGSEAPPANRLTDDDPSTGWYEGHPGDGRGEHLSFIRGTSTSPIAALSFILRGETVPRGAGWPTSLRLLGEDGQDYRVRLPERPGANARYWVELPEPLRGRCVSMVFETIGGPRPRVSHAGLMEVQMLLDVERPGGVARLMDEIVADSVEGASAALLLSRLGEPAVEAIAEAWDRLTPLGHRRAIRALRANLDSAPLAREVLNIAAVRGTQEVRQDALDALVTLGEGALPALITLLSLEGDEHGEAFVPLTQAIGDPALPALLRALQSPNGQNRPEIRAAIRGLIGQSESAAETLRGLFADPSFAPPTCASLSLALAQVSPTLTESALRCALGGLADLGSIWRVLRALDTEGLPPHPGAQRWLATQVRESERWMVREAALHVLGRRYPDAPLASVYRQALADPHPRVRAAATAWLALPTDAQRLITRAQRDQWPMVRAAAVTRLATAGIAAEEVRGAIGDPNRGVRHAAISAVTATADPLAWPQVQARLENSREWPEVVRAGVAYIGATCQSEGLPWLIRLIRAVYRGSPDAESRQLAADAALTLRRFRDDRAEDELRRLQAPHAPAYLRRVMENASQLSRPCQSPAN